MILRRKRILYRRARYSTRPIRPPKPVAKPIVMPRPAHSQLLQHELNEESKEKSNPSLPKTEPTLATSQVQSTTKSATTLDPERFRIASTPSAVSSTRYTDIDAHEDLVFPPPPPALKNHSMEVTCPYCLYSLPSREFQSVARWRKHVLADLDPLVCLFDRCDRPETLYNHTKDWLRHMRKHTEHWRCTAKSHGLLKFATFEEFLLHMQIGHGKNYTKSQIGLLSERKAQVNGPLFEFCPLCGGIPEEKGDDAHNGMIGHIVGHLRSLALKSLPPIHLDSDDAFLKMKTTRDRLAAQ
ncbi:hypothetical protein BJ166DRAFT_271959 [Pestalotiopsis sp. NC0098]|nr:hypothetical protein BJ166DRAFT_271959 [Pestalotiopsis sp. NC0098]